MALEPVISWMSGKGSLIVWANSLLPVPTEDTWSKTWNRFPTWCLGTSNQGPIGSCLWWLTIAKYVNFVKHPDRCKIARVEKKIMNFYFSFFIHFLCIIYRKEPNRSVCLICGNVGKITCNVWKLLSQYNTLVVYLYTKYYSAIRQNELIIQQ